MIRIKKKSPWKQSEKDNYGEFCSTKPAIKAERGTANKTNSDLLLLIYFFFSGSFFTLFTVDLNWTPGSAI